MIDVKPAGRVALVTGASRGIGAATVTALARRGIATVLAVRNPDAAQKALAAAMESGTPCKVRICNVSDYDSVRGCIDETLNEWGRLDIVVNNAGQIEPQATLVESDPAAWAQAIQVNLVGPYHVIRAALPALLQRRGAIVNVSTGAAHAPRDCWSAYCASKAGLYMLSRAVLNEYGKQGLSVYSLQPGLVDTDMQARIRRAGANEISRIAQEKLVPPELPAGVIAWLADTLPSDLMNSDLTVNDQTLLTRSGLAN